MPYCNIDSLASLQGCIDDEKKIVFRTTEGGEPLVFVLGEGEVIEGWEKGIMGMWCDLLDCLSCCCKITREGRICGRAIINPQIHGSRQDSSQQCTHATDICSVGERRKLKIPASMAYKDIGHPGMGIPGKENHSLHCVRCLASPCQHTSTCISQ